MTDFAAAPVSDRGSLLRSFRVAFNRWFTAQQKTEKSINRALDRQHHDILMLRETGMTRRDVSRMIDRAGR